MVKITKIKDKLENLPPKPGVYLFLGENKKVIYIGKAKNLKKRVNSYFQKTKQIAPDKLIMLSQTTDIDYIITDTEAEALLLESTLIKKHEPRFNIVLKDDKSYLYIKIDLEQEWPKVYTVRRPVHRSSVKRGEGGPDFKDSNFYAGPYANADAARQTLKLASKIFKFCTCKNFLKKPCLRYHLGWCFCPVETKISNPEYRKIFAQVKKFLKGQTSEVLRELKLEMKKASNQKKYEDAARFRDQIQAIERTTAKQKVISTKLENYDVISLARADDSACINLFVVREGKLINKLNFILEHIGYSTDTEIIESFITQYYPTTTDVPKEIIAPIGIKTLMPHPPAGLSADEAGEAGASCLMPHRGKKLQLLNLGTTNAQNYLRQHLSTQATQASSNKKLLSDLKSVLRLPTTLIRIEAYDISNIQGQNATGSMVVFTNGQPNKSEYRRFAINPRIYSGGANDVAMLAEVIHRRLQNKDWPKPDLILLDGGKPQLNAIKKIQAFKHSSIQAISLAKREEHIFIPNRKTPIILPKTSSILQLLQRVRDEAHRFARGYYLKRHEKESVRSVLNDIPGIGPKTKKKLLQKFGSVEGIKRAGDDEVGRVVGKKLVRKLREYL